MEFKGTKGKWSVLYYAGSLFVQDGKFFRDNNLLDMSAVGKETARHNALLMSKAPEMLERLESLSDMVIRKCNLNNDAELKDLLKEVQAAKELIQSATELKEIRE